MNNLSASLAAKQQQLSSDSRLSSTEKKFDEEQGGQLIASARAWAQKAYEIAEKYSNQPSSSSSSSSSFLHWPSSSSSLSSSSDHRQNEISPSHTNGHGSDECSLACLVALHNMAELAERAGDLLPARDYFQRAMALSEVVITAGGNDDQDDDDDDDDDVVESIRLGAERGLKRISDKLGS